MGTDFEQVAGRQDGGRTHQRRLGSALAGQHEGAARAGRGQAHRQRAADGAQLAAQRQLAGEFVAGEVGVPDLPRGDQNAQRDRQIEAARLLGQVSGREIDRDPALREFVAAILDRRADAVACLLDLGIGQTDQGECRQAAGEMHLDGDLGGFHAGQGPALEDGECHDVGILRQKRRSSRINVALSPACRAAGSRIPPSAAAGRTDSLGRSRSRRRPEDRAAPRSRRPRRSPAGRACAPSR